MALLWATSLPDYFAAVDGVTAHGDPIGSLWYTLACFVIAGLSIAAASAAARVAGSDRGGSDAVAAHPG